ncbi:hypothetical protein HQ524_00525 [Candidatus Uhrbacteria bacterium]|nr:hypothetical protein [Candidatus Uhrbacteria bacterium]
MGKKEILILTGAMLAGLGFLMHFAVTTSYTVPWAAHAGYFWAGFITASGMFCTGKGLLMK